MATDYDAPRRTAEDLGNDNVSSLDQLRASKSEQATAVALADDADPSELELDLPDADLSGEELVVQLLPAQPDEFTCTSCWLVHHVSQRIHSGIDECRDCAA